MRSAQFIEPAGEPPLPSLVVGRYDVKHMYFTPYGIYILYDDGKEVIAGAANVRFAVLENA